MSDAAETQTEAQVAEELEKAAEETQKIEAKLEEPNLSDAQTKKLEDHLQSLDQRMDSLIEKLDKLAASPVAPAPPKTVATVKETEEVKVAAEESASGTPKKRKAYVSSRWFGDRAYED